MQSSLIWRKRCIRPDKQTESESKLYFVLYLNLGFLVLIYEVKRLCFYHKERIIRTQKIVCIVQSPIHSDIHHCHVTSCSLLHTRSTSVNKSAIAKIIFICLPLLAIKTMKNLFEMRHYFFCNQCRNFLSLCFCN